MDWSWKRAGCNNFVCWNRKRPKRSPKVWLCSRSWYESTPKTVTSSSGILSPCTFLSTIVTDRSSSSWFHAEHSLRSLTNKPTSRTTRMRPSFVSFGITSTRITSKPSNLKKFVDWSTSTLFFYLQDFIWVITFSTTFHLQWIQLWVLWWENYFQAIICLIC